MKHLQIDKRGTADWQSARRLTACPTLFACAVGLIVIAAAGRTATAPKFSNEQLHYNVNWPSGLSLGEGTLHATRSKPAENGSEHVDLEFNIEAAIPGFQVQDHYRSDATSDLCSVSFERKFQHGKRKSDEKTTFDQEKGTASRETVGGGKTEIKTSSCAKDALAFLYFVRRELSQGRLPPSQPVYFGSAYQMRVEFGGTQTIKLGDTSVEADRLMASFKGPASDINFEVFFLKDAARTPALVRVPLSLGTFSMELVR